MELVLIWIFMGVVCYILAGNKNRNQVGWAIAGVIFGIFAIIILAILPKLEELAVSQKLEEKSGSIDNKSE